MSFLAAAGVACLLLAPTLARAQAIGGTVTDTTGGVLPGVTVEARSPALIEQVRTAVTDGNGQYLIVALETGTYSVTFTLPGFSTLVREGVDLGTGFTANVDGQMAVGALEETVIVTEATPTIDVQSVRQSETIDREIFEVLPTTRGYDSLALLIPAMNIQGGPSTAVPIDTGGLSGVPNNRLTIHGSDEYDAEVHIDGFDVNSVAFDGAPGALPQDTSIAEYVYDYSSNAAEVETGGVRMNMIPKEGSNTFTGGFYANYGHPSWLANNVDQDLIDRGIIGGKDGAFRADQTWQVAPQLGGPLVRDHLWFYGSYTYRRASFFPSGLFNSTDTSSLIYVPDPDNPTREVSNNYEYTGRLTWQATARDKVQVYYANSNVKQTPALTGSQLYPLYIAPEAGSEGTSAFNTYQVTWIRPQTDRILFEAGYSRLPAHSILYPLNNEFGAKGDGAHFGARTDLPGLLELAGPIPLAMSRNMGGLFEGNTVWFSTLNQTARASMSYVTGSHNLKVGFRTTLKWQNETYRSGSNWTNARTVFGSPVMAVFVSRPPETNQLTNTGVYVQDQWTLDRLTINAGLRWDYFNGYYPDHVSAPGQPGHSTWVPHPIMIDGETATIWKDLQPRLGVVYDLRGDGRTALKASASRFGSRDAISLAGELNPIANNRTHDRLWSDGMPFNLLVGGGAVPLPSCFGDRVHPRRRHSAGRSEPALSQRRAVRLHQQRDPRRPCPHPALRSRVGVRLGSEEGQLGVLGERAARAAGQRLARRRLLPAQLHQLRRVEQPGRRSRGLRELHDHGPAGRPAARRGRLPAHRRGHDAGSVRPGAGQRQDRHQQPRRRERDVARRRRQHLRPGRELPDAGRPGYRAADCRLLRLPGASSPRSIGVISTPTLRRASAAGPPDSWPGLPAAGATCAPWTSAGRRKTG